MAMELTNQFTHELHGSKAKKENNLIILMWVFQTIVLIFFLLTLIQTTM